MNDLTTESCALIEHNKALRGLCRHANMRTPTKPDYACSYCSDALKVITLHCTVLKLAVQVSGGTRLISA